MTGINQMEHQLTNLARKYERQALANHELQRTVINLGGSTSDISRAFALADSVLRGAEPDIEEPYQPSTEEGPMDRYSNLLEAEVQKRLQQAHEEAERMLREEREWADELEKRMITAEAKLKQEEELLYNERMRAEELEKRMITAEARVRELLLAQNKTELDTPHPDQTTLNMLAFGASNEYLSRALIDVAEGERVTHMKSALLTAAADRLGVDVFPSDETLKRQRMTKGEIADALFPEHKGYRYDCALPQGWLDNVERRLLTEDRERAHELGGVAFHFVTVYHPEICPHGQIMPITKSGVSLLSTMYA